MRTKVPSPIAEITQPPFQKTGVTCSRVVLRSRHSRFGNGHSMRMEALFGALVTATSFPKSSMAPRRWSINHAASSCTYAWNASFRRPRTSSGDSSSFSDSSSFLEIATSFSCAHGTISSWAIGPHLPISHRQMCVRPTIKNRRLSACCALPTTRHQSARSTSDGDGMSSGWLCHSPR